MFGEYIKKRRLEKDLTLREFCRRLDEDASNWSKVERGVMGPPQDKEKLRKIAIILGIKENSDDWKELTTMASIGAGVIPEYIMSDKNIVDALPVFFRTIGSVKPTKEEIEELIQTIKRGV
ncbi:MAG: helix-turn-helix domain-containing protein [Syntrophorhabdus sp.]